MKKFIFDKYDDGIYRVYKILGIKITTKPIKNRLNDLFNKLNSIEYNLEHYFEPILHNTLLNYDQNILNNIQSPYISIIVPVYNVENEYLIRCLNSLVQQSFKKIEIILVNDCSEFKENEDICLEYAKKDHRIKYIKNIKNIGPGGSRMEGLKAAKGDIIMFVDPDDEISFNACEIIAIKFIQTNADVLGFNYYWIENGKYINNIRPNKHYLLYNESILLNFAEGNIQMQLWDKAYKKELLLNIGDKLIPNYYNAEDTVATFKIMYNAKLLAYIPINLYLHNRRNTSITNELKPKSLYNIYNCIEEIHNFLEENNSLEKNKDIFEKYVYFLFRNSVFLINNKLKHDNSNKLEYHKILLELLTKTSIYLNETSIENIKILIYKNN